MNVLLILFFLFLIAPGSQQSQKPKKSMTTKSIENVLAANSDSIMAIKGVVGVGISQLDGKPCLKVMVDRISRITRKQIPKTLDGFPVVIEETGEFKARARTPQY